MPARQDILGLLAALKLTAATIGGACGQVKNGSGGSPGPGAGQTPRPSQSTGGTRGSGLGVSCTGADHDHPPRRSHACPKQMTGVLCGIKTGCGDPLPDHERDGLAREAGVVTRIAAARRWSSCAWLPP